jgi:hypothetical protein
MAEFNILNQVKSELEDFHNNRIVLANAKPERDVRTLTAKDQGKYAFSQAETIALIDLYASSQFESGPEDSLGHEKIFINVGNFRTDVAAKQVDIDVKDFRFIPENHANTWPAFFMQLQFREYAKESYFGELVNKIVENYPKYGTVVLKKVKNKVEFVPLQNLKNEQSADSLQKASYVIEEHSDMPIWEIQEMPDWKTDGLDFKPTDCVTVYERYGRVPEWWLKNHNGETVENITDEYVDAVVFLSIIPAKGGGKKDASVHVYYAKQITKRPYEEEHWKRVHGRWLGVGVMEDQFPNQKAKNIGVNLFRRALQIGGKIVLQTKDASKIAKNLVTEVEDGELVEVGDKGDIQRVDLSSKSQLDIQQLLQESEKNSDQKAFTYEVSTGEGMASGTPFRLGVLLSQAVNSYFSFKREKLGLFFKRVMQEFLIPEFKRSLRNTDKLITVLSDEPGYNILKGAAMDMVKSETIRATLMNAEPVDAQTLADAIQPFEAVTSLFFMFKKGLIDTIEAKFVFTITGEEIDVAQQMETLGTIYQIMVQRGDPRAEEVMRRMSALAGYNMDTFGPPPAPVQQISAGKPGGQPSPNMKAPAPDQGTT